MITRDELSWCLNKFSQLVVNEMYEDQGLNGHRVLLDSGL